MANRRGNSPIKLTSPGSAIVFGFIALAIGMGILFTRGIAPKSTLTDPGTGEFELIDDTPIPGQKGLQLRTLRFKECASTITIDLLLDHTGSMQDENKLNKLKQAVLFLTGKLTDESVIGVQTFNSFAINDDVPIAFYKDVKSTLPVQINALQPAGQTPTHNALEFSYNKLKVAIDDPRFKGRKFNFLLVSDGEPVPDSQDPRLFDPNPADQIKSLGVNVYTIGIFTLAQSVNPKMSDLLKSIASKPDNYYAAPTGDKLQELFTTIANKICQNNSAN